MKKTILFSLCCLLGLTNVSANASEPVKLEVSRTGLAHDSLFDIAFEGADGLAVGDHGVILESTDGGATWQRTEVPGISDALLAVDILGDRSLVVGQQGLVLMRDGSKSWSRQESGTSERLLRVALHDSGFAVATGGFGTVLRSRDFGQTWESLSIGWENFIDDPGYTPHIYDVEILADGRMLLAGEFGLILESPDQGETWLQRNTGDESIFALQIAEDGSGFAVGQNAYLARTRDGGTNWQKVELDGTGNLLNVWQSDDGFVVATGIRSFYASFDGGETWQNQRHPVINRAWYTGLAKSGPNGEEAVGEGRLLMGGVVGMIVEIKR